MVDLLTAKKQISRRRFLRLVAWGAGAGLAMQLGQFREMKPQSVIETRLLMGTVIHLTVLTDDRSAAQRTVTASLQQMAQLESVLSRFLPDSQLSQLNRTGYLKQPHQALLGLLQQAHTVSEASGGAFDVTVGPLLTLYEQYRNQGNSLPPEKLIREKLARVNYRCLIIEDNYLSLAMPGMAITIDGIAKGYIVDRGVEVLRQSGYPNVLVEAGGDLLASGQKTPQGPWEIGIQAPRSLQGEFVTTIGVQNQAVATSGDYMQLFSPNFQHHHIVNPHSGRSPAELASSTVIAPSATLADALATTLMVLSPREGLSLIERWPACEALLITKDLQMLKSSGLS